jgi:hypothetical protein
LNETTGQASPAPFNIYANRADLYIPFELHPFTGHGNETPSVPNSDRTARFVSSLRERAGLGSPLQVKHVFRIDAGQPDHVPIINAAGITARGDHLVDNANILHLWNIEFVHLTPRIANQPVRAVAGVGRERDRRLAFRKLSPQKAPRQDGIAVRVRPRTQDVRGSR